MILNIMLHYTNKLNLYYIDSLLINDVLFWLKETKAILKTNMK